MGHNSVIIDTTHGLIYFPHLTMQVKSAASDTSAKPQDVLFHDSITVPPMTTRTLTAFADHSLEWNTTGTVARVKKITETASLLKSHSMSTKIDKKIAVRVNNTTESPFSIGKIIQIVEFSVVTPEQSQFFRPMDTPILTMIPTGDPDLTTYLNHLLRANEPEQQNNTSWFLTPESPGIIEDHTPIQIRTLKDLHDLKKNNNYIQRTQIPD